MKRLYFALIPLTLLLLIVPAAAQPASCQNGYRLVEHAAGETCVPAQPSRIVSLHDLDVTYALASLGVIPVATAATNEADPFARMAAFGPVPDGLSQTTFIGTIREPNLERILALNPDLIIGTVLSHASIYEQLSTIAPTVLIDQTAGEDAVSNQRFLADLAGATAVFEERLAGYQERIEQLRNAYPDLWPDLEFVRLDSFGPDSHYLINGVVNTPAFQVLYDLGAVQSNTVQGFDVPFPQISLEGLADLDGDLIFLGLAADAEIDPLLSQLLATTFAGQRGQVFVVNYSIWGFRNVDALYLVLNDIERFLSERQLDVSGEFRDTAPSACEAGYRLVEHKLLEEPICVPEKPQRIVAAHLNAFEIMLMSGIQPVARVSDDFLKAVYGGAPAVYERVMELVGDAPIYGSGPVDVNTEVLLSVQPDLVIAYQGMPNIDQLREFTTVVESPIAAFQPSSWSELGELFALVMGVEDAYAVLLTEYDTRIETFHEMIRPEFEGASLVFVQNTPSGNFVAFPGMPLWETIADGGFVPVETLPTTAEDALAAYGTLVIPLNDEMLSTINADIIIMVNGSVRQDDRATSDAVIAGFATNPLWQALRAVQNDQFYARSVYWQSNGIVSAHAVVDDFFAMFADADPAQVAPNPFLNVADER